ncbi:MAG: MFS transporter [Coriobacteriales bacterium]|jgi:MFS family permease|nr:MFS transporter [Coriobacteriales bacterium]
MSTQAKTTQPQQVPVPRYAWVILAVVFLASLSAAMNYLKPPGIASTLIPWYEIGIDQFGLLMSVFSITGVVLALPAGLILSKIGVKKAVLASVGFCFVGAIVGIFAETFPVLLFSRFLEGIGESVVFVAAPAAIVAWFPYQRQGVAFGVWSICMPAGSFIMLNTAPHLTAAFGWQSVWVMGAIISGVAFILYALFFRMPIRSVSEQGASVMGETDDEQPSLSSLLQVLKNRDVWLAGLIFGCFNFVVATVIGSYYPYFLETQLQTPNALASSISSIPELVSIIGGPIIGLIADRVGRRKPLLMVGCLVLGVAGALVFMASSAWMAAGLMFVFGAIAPLVTAGVRLVIPEVTGENHLKVGMGNAVLSFFLNLVGLIGPIVAGIVVVHLGWAEIGFFLFIPLFACAFVASTIIRAK